MKTFRMVAAFALACVITPLHAQSRDAPPSTPAGLVARAYSATSGGIVWQRSTDDRGAVAGYEIRRDGRMLGVFDALSYIDRTLGAGRVHRYSVTAIDGAGQRSETAVVRLTTPDAPPRQPANLRANVYSSTAAGLRWDRASAFGTRYEVRRDGIRVAMTDDVTHIDTGLDGGRSYRFEVIALNREGLRSAPARLLLRTPGGAGPDEPDRLLVAPTIERIDIYSATAAELFWRRPPPGSPITRVEVSRDGIVLGVTVGTSYFDDTRSPGVTYRYSLVAIAADGRRSDEGIGGELIRSDNAVDLISAVFDAFRGASWGEYVFALPGFSRKPEFPFENQFLNCENGGTAKITFISTGVGVGRGFVFDDCQDGGTLFDGQVQNYQQQFFRVVSPGITITGPSATVRYTGFVIDARAGQDRRWLVRDPVDFVRRAADGAVYSLSGARIDFSYGSGRGGPPFPVILLSGGFALASGQTGGARMLVDIPETLARPVAFDPDTGPEPVPTDWTFTEGSLRVTAPDGSSLLLEADNGDESSARVTITSVVGETTSFEQPWSVWLGNLRFD